MQQGVVHRFRAKRAQSGWSELDEALAVFEIIQNQLLPVRANRILNSEELLGLNILEIRRLHDVAKQHRAGHGGGSPAPSAEVRLSGSSASKQPPVSPPEPAAGAEWSATPAPIPAPARKHFATKKPKVAEATEPAAGEPAQADTAPTVDEPESKPAVCVGQTPVQAMAQGDEVTATGNVRRLTVPPHRVEGSPALSNAAGVEDANETASPRQERLTTPPADARKEELDRCVATLTSPESSRLDRGYALLSIIENRLIHVLSNGIILEAKRKFSLTPLEVRKLVALAKEHRDQNGGGGASAPSAGARHDGDSASKQPASPPDAVARDERSAAPAPIAAPEKKRARTTKPKAAEATAPQGREPVHNLARPPVETAMSSPAEPALAPAGPFEQAAEADTAPSVAKPETRPAKCVGHAPVHAAKGKEPPTPPSAERLPYLESVIGKGFMFVFEVGAALEEIRDDELFSPQFKTFAEYFNHKWGWTRARCYQLIGAAQVRRNLSTRVDTAHLSEPLCRVLSKFPDDDQVAAWKDAISAAPDGKPTLLHLKQAVARICPPPPDEPLVSGEAEPPTESNVEPEVVAPDDTQPARPVEGAAATGQLETLTVADSAPCASAEFDLHAEVQLLKETLTSLFRRCPQCKQAALWRKLNAIFCQSHDIGSVDQSK